MKNNIISKKIISRDDVRLLREAKVEADKKKDVKYSAGCLMAQFDFENWQENVNHIKEEDLYLPEGNENKYGVESEPHVTVCYGFVDDELKVQDIIDKINNYLGPIEIKIKGITIFENEKFDVVKYDIESTQLHELNQYFMNNFPVNTEFPEYKPHMTLAYVKPGEGKKYIEIFEEPIIMYTVDFIYSMSCNQKLKLKCKSIDVANGYKYDTAPPTLELNKTQLLDIISNPQSCLMKLGALKPDNIKESSADVEPIEINIKVTNIDSVHAQELCNMINYMDALASIGSSREFKAFVDGDGSFRAKFEITCNNNIIDTESKELDIEKDEKVGFDFC